MKINFDLMPTQLKNLFSWTMQLTDWSIEVPYLITLSCYMSFIRMAFSTGGLTPGLDPIKIFFA